MTVTRDRYPMTWIASSVRGGFASATPKFGRSLHVLLQAWAAPSGPHLVWACSAGAWLLQCARNGAARVLHRASHQPQPGALLATLPGTAA
eukprot:365603-Chlamydomonas_euryale.AAC.22